MIAERWAQEAETMLRSLRPPAPVAVGTLVRVVGLTLEARGLQAPLGALCRVRSDDGAAVDAEVVGFNDGVLYLMPFTEPVGIGPGAQVALLARIPSAALGE
jgi:flagellum-specific ATP synthase